MISYTFQNFENFFTGKIFIIEMLTAEFIITAKDFIFTPRQMYAPQLAGNIGL